VVEFVVGRVLSHNGGTDAASGIDDVTAYYLLHRHDFGMKDAPIGACILYAISCGLSDSALADQHDVLVRIGKEERAEPDAEESEAESEEGSGNRVKLKAWNQRKRDGMGYESRPGKPVPLIDQVHRLMHLWKLGDVIRVNDYLDARGLGQDALFPQLTQALIELAPEGSEERSLLESISNQLKTRGVKYERQGSLDV
jgi:hypothetical protein